MKPPTMKMGKFTVKYKQVEDFDRYFFIYYNVPCSCGSEPIMKIPEWIAKEEGLKVFPYDGTDMNMYKRYVLFWDRVETYNKILEQDEGY